MNRVTTVLKVSRMMKMIALLHSYMHVRAKIYWKSSCVNIKCVYNTYVEKYSRDERGAREDEIRDDITSYHQPSHMNQPCMHDSYP